MGDMSSGYTADLYSSSLALGTYSSAYTMLLYGSGSSLGLYYGKYCLNFSREILDQIMLFEDGEIMLLEDGNRMVFNGI